MRSPNPAGGAHEPMIQRDARVLRRDQHVLLDEQVHVLIALDGRRPGQCACD
jgi:hypothetical protein